MKNIKTLFAVLVAFIFVMPVFAQEAPASIKIEKMPKTPAEFTEMRNKIAITPEGGATMFVVAMLTYAENKELGMQFFTIALDRRNLVKKAGGAYRGFHPGNGAMYHIKRLKDPSRKHLPYSYISGTSAAKGYKATLPYTFEFSRNKYSVQAPDKIKVFIACSGASSARPVTLKKNGKGHWKAYEFSTLSVDVQAPKALDYDDEL